MGSRNELQLLMYLFSAQGQLSPKAWAEKHRSAFEEQKKRSGVADGKFEECSPEYLGYVLPVRFDCLWLPKTPLSGFQPDVTFSSRG